MSGDEKVQKKKGGDSDKVTEGKEAEEEGLLRGIKP